MADFHALEALINAYIKQNGVQAITGQILNGVLRGMVSALGKGWTVAGQADPSTDPGTMTGPVAYIAHEAGTYTHFGGLVVDEGEVAFLKYNEQVWTKEVLASMAAVATVDGNVGTPYVDTQFVNGVLTFAFHNMKGNPGVDGTDGQDGAAAGFGTVNATVDGNVGTPGVSVSSSGPDTAKNFTFAFTNLKGETGVTSAVVTVDNTSGAPQCAVSLVGQELHLDFTGLKGVQGNTGVSADYPITIYNGVDSDATDEALAAAQGKFLQGEISQLEAEVHNLSGKNYGVFVSVDDLPEGDVVGYAFVGVSDPFELYRFNGEEWEDTETTISGIQGPPGVQGIQGVQGEPGQPGIESVSVSVDNTSGTPSAVATIFNQNLSIALSGIKGEQGNSGYQGAANELQVVNNLTDGGATDALSAQMGVQLESEINATRNELDGLDSMYVTQANFDIYVSTMIKSDGSVAAPPWSGNARCGLMEIPQLAKKVQIIANNNGATYYAFLTSDSLVNGQQAPFATGCSIVTVALGTDTGEVTIPDDAVYLYIYCSTSNTGTLERFPSTVGFFGDGSGLRQEIEQILKVENSARIRTIDADCYDGAASLGYIGTDGVFNSSVLNQYILIPISDWKRVNVRANSNGATYFAFLTSDTLTVGVQAPFSAKTNLVNLSALQSSGIVNIPYDAQYLYVFVSVSPANWARFPVVNLFKDGEDDGNKFAIIDNDFTDVSIFTGLDSARVTADGYTPATGFNNRVTINKLITAEEYKLSYYVTLSNLSSVICLASTSSGLTKRSTIVTFDFGNGTIDFHNPSDNGNTMTNVKLSKAMDSVTGSIYRLEVGRHNRNVFAAVTNLTTGIRTEFVPTDTSNKGTDYGWLYDYPTFSLISGGCTIHRILETMPKNPFMVFIGDSLTAGFGVDFDNAWAKKCCDHYGNSFVSARSNGTITEMLGKIYELSVVKPRYVVVTIGTNGGDTTQNMMQLRDLIKGIGCVPIINCIPQKSGTGSIATTAAVNDIILSLGCLCSRFDYATSLDNDLSEGGNPAYYQSDGTHLNNDGNTAVYNRFLADMEMLY